MTQLLERSLQEESSSHQSARTLFGGGDRGRSIQIGLVLAVVIWIGLLFLIQQAAKHFSVDIDPATMFAESKKPEFSIELASDVSEEDRLVDELKKNQPPLKLEEEKQLVPVNADAPDNVPDNTRNLGARNQQVAQETPNLGKESDIPSTFDGDPEFGAQIKSGQLASEAPVPVVVPNATEAAVIQNAQVAGNASENVQGVQATTAARDILSGNEKNMGEDKHGIGSNIVKIPPVAPLADEKVEGAESQSLNVVEAKRKGAEKAIDPKQPRPRPRLEAGQVGTLIQNTHGTSNRGIIASDARWSQFGEYDQKMWETIVIQWQTMLQNQRVFPIEGSYVIVTFRLNNMGEIAEVLAIESTAGMQIERLCVSAITTRSPYGAWPEDMRSVLGDDLILKIKFSF